MSSGRWAGQLLRHSLRKEQDQGLSLSFGEGRTPSISAVKADLLPMVLI